VPAVLARRIEHERGVAEHFGTHSHLAANLVGQRRGNLGDVDHQRIATPVHRAGSNRKVIAAARHRLAPAFGHRPGPAARAVEGDVDRAVVLRIAASAEFVIWRKNAANERDDRQAVLAVGAGRIDIPPGIAARPDRDVEAWSRSRQATAKRADNAAIGTPAPGWVLPPAQ
jgi:hypothetical protein